MTIDTLGYVKRLEGAGIERRIAEAHVEALKHEVVPQLATKQDLERAVERLETKIDAALLKVDAALLKHTVAIVLVVVAVGGFLLRFAQ